MTAVSNKSALTYKKLSDSVFFWSTIILQLFIVTLALSISNIEVVFEFIGAVGSSSIMLLFPGLAYIVCLHKYGSSEYKKKWSTVFWYALAWFFLTCWLVLLISFFYVEIGKLMGTLSSDEVLLASYE